MIVSLLRSLNRSRPDRPNSIKTRKIGSDIGNIAENALGKH
ncbi:hypothetical protein [Chamaesiphon sp. VAR_69_metabat_338]|nr:hypothetical protein [Chamaesiphon sp. VAR_69_metabat_338]